MKTKLSFVDAADNKVNIEIEIRQDKYQNGKRDWETLQIVENPTELSICGDVAGSAGQCYNHITPTPTQKRLVDFWREYHLNGLCAGTKQQEEALKDCTEKDYCAKCEYLEQKGLLVDRGYKYGTGWLYKSFPAHELQQIIDDIEQEEQQRLLELQDKNDYDINDDSNDAELINAIASNQFEEEENAKYMLALARHLNLCYAEIDDITCEAHNEYKAQGRNYYVGTYDELKELAISQLTDNPELWQQAVASGSTEMGLHEWAKWVIQMDGFQSVLNSWDGSYTHESVNGENIYICRNF